jgi:hypothetical protein
MLSGYTTPEIVPRIGIMVQVEQDFETSDRGFPVRGLELPVDGGREQKRTHGIHQFAAPELIGMPGCHPDHVEERSDKAAAHQSMMGRRLIEVECASDGHDSFEMRRSSNGSLHLRSGEITDANHADVAVRPGLLCGPFDEVIHVAAFLPVKETEGAARTTGPPTIGDYMDVTARHEKVASTSFDETGWCTKILNLSGIGRGGNQHRILTGHLGTMRVRHQHDSITRWHLNVVIV